MKMTKHLVLSSALAIALLVMSGGVATAAVKCDFTRDLQLGVEGDDVKCLQQYLNSQGFVIATEGVGSFGKETTQFKDLTKKAVMTWQTAQGVTPATGYFGAKSRQKYADLVNGTVTPPTTTPPVVIPPVTPPTSSETEIALLKQQIAALTSRLTSLENKVEDSMDNEDDNGDEDKADAKSLIKKADNLINDVQDSIDAADDDGDDTEDAQDLLDEAEDALDDANNAYDDEDWEDAIDSAKDAIDLAHDAEDEL